MIEYFTPSYKRAGNVKVASWLPDVQICCHEFEVDEYLENNPDHKIIAIPDSLKGNMAKVRNFILSGCGADICVMLDDDVEFIGYYEYMEQFKLSPEQLNTKINEWADQARALHTILFGVNLQLDPKFYREYSPISLQGPVLGPFCCILTDDKSIQYDERLSLNEDYDFFLQVLRKYHKVLRWNKYHYKAGHLSQAGGCAAYRLFDVEKEQAAIMQGKWGSNIVKYDFKRSTNPRLISPFKGI